MELGMISRGRMEASIACWRARWPPDDRHHSAHRMVIAHAQFTPLYAYDTAPFADKPLATLRQQVDDRAVPAL